MADYDRDGFLDLYLCAYGYFIGVSEDKAGPPSPYHDALNGSPNVLLRNDGHGKFVDVTADVGLDENNDRFSFAPAWGDYDEDGWPDLLVANDFGRKNLYHNLGLVNGRVRFKDVAHEAGRRGLRRRHERGVRRLRQRRPARHLHRQHVDGGRPARDRGRRASSPTPRRRSRRSTGVTRAATRSSATAATARSRTSRSKARAEFGRWAWSSDALRFRQRRLGGPLRRQRHVHARRRRARRSTSTASSGGRWSRSRRSTRTPGTSYDDGWRATNRLLVSDGAQAQHERNVLLRNDGHGGFDEISGTVGPRRRSGRPRLRRLRLRRRRRCRRRPDGAALVAAAAAVPQRLRVRQRRRSRCG